MGLGTGCQFPGGQTGSAAIPDERRRPLLIPVLEISSARCPVQTFRRPATNPGPTSLLKGFQEVEGVFTNALVVGALHPLSECARTMVGETRTWCDYSPGRLPSS